MGINIELRQKKSKENSFSLEAFLFGFSAYALPLLIGIASLMALLLWQPHYETSDTKQLAFSAVEESQQALTPAQALAALQGKAVANHHDTRLSEAPVWFSF